MVAIINWLRAFKRRIDALHGLGPVWDDVDDDMSDLDRLNFELAEIAYRQQAYAPPSVADSEE